MEKDVKKELHFTDETHEYLQQTRDMKRLEVELKEEGFAADEIKKTLEKVREMEGLEVEKTVEKVVEKEETLSIDPDMLQEVVADAIGDIKAQITEVTGKVN
jgi:uncharacterized protein Smg (DUF494 family)